MLPNSDNLVGGGLLQVPVLGILSIGMMRSTGGCLTSP